MLPRHLRPKASADWCFFLVILRFYLQDMGTLTIPMQDESGGPVLCMEQCCHEHHEQACCDLGANVGAYVDLSPRYGYSGYS